MTHQRSTLRRALTSAAKFWVCKRGCELSAEAMEMLGGNGYTEEFSLARIVREMPVNSIWEGSGNVMCLDVLRAFAKSPATSEVVLRELSCARGRIGISTPPSSGSPRSSRAASTGLMHADFAQSSSR